MIDREYTLNRLRSRSITPQEFNFEILSAPPILSMFTAEDIQQLNYIVTSATYSAKLKEKYKAIDDIMTNRGFKKLVSGTNRVAYEPLFSNNFIVKVAYDSVALKDSIREYYNQFLIKPFCTKVFEVSPCGTLGVFERVNPVTNRKEYMSMAADIYKLLSEFIIGQYIIDDIGTEYFQNIGFRNGFGAVVLDFPYVYEVDGKKIYCNKPDPNDPTGYCNGAIDYDLGFNKLKCKKCGAIYKPFELAKKIEYTKQIINESEERVMIKVRRSGGSKGFENNEVVTGEFRNPVTAIKSNMMNKKVEKQLEEEKKKTVNGVAAPKEEPKQEEASVVEEAKVEEPVTEEAIEEAKEEVEEEKKAIKPFSINEDDKGKGDLGYIADDNDNIEALTQAINNLYYGKETSDEARAEIAKNCAVMLEEIFMDNIDITIKMFANILRKRKNLKDEVIKEFLENNSCSINNQFLKLLLASENYYLMSEVKSCGSDDDNIIFNIAASIFKAKTDKPVYTGENIEATLAKDTIIGVLGLDEKDISDETLVEEEDDEDLYDSVNAKGLDLANAIIVSKKDLFPKEKNGKVMVVKNDNGTYLTLNEKILAIHNIDGRSIQDVTIVPNEWYEDAMAKIEAMKEAPVGALPEEEEVEDEEASGEE